MLAWWEIGLRLLAACVISSLIGWDRELHHRPAGIRTHILVCTGAAVIAVMEELILLDTVRVNAQAGFDTGVTLDRARFTCQVVSGIGFLGAGTIFISQKKVAGLTTAASLWINGCLGLACGYGYYGLAGAGGVIVILTLKLLQRLINTRSIRRVSLEFTDKDAALPLIREVFEKYKIQVRNTEIKVENKHEKKNFEMIYTLELPVSVSMETVVTELAACPGMETVKTMNTPA